MAQKFGGAIGGSAALWLLAGFGYITDPALTAAADFAGQPSAALLCLRCLMSFIPAAVSLIAIFVVSFYPLTTERMREIDQQLQIQRAHESN